jgi:hypothetical protein
MTLYVIDVVQTLVEAKIGGVDEKVWMRYSKKVHCNYLFQVWHWGE